MLLNSIDKRLDIALLFEHKSVPHKHVLIQVGYYLFAHYYKCIVEKKPLKLVVPIIYYQGKRKWKVKDLSTIFGDYPDSILSYAPTIHHVFVALQSVPDETLLAMKNSMMTVAMIAQKWRKNPVKIVEDIIRVLSIFKDELHDRNFLQQTFVYILETSDVPSEDFKKIIESIPPKLKEDLMTTYSRIASKHEQIGIQKGANKKLMEFVLNSYDNGIDLSLIVNITKLSENEVIKILRENGKMKLHPNLNSST